MTVINTKTSNWEITFQADKLRELSTSQQEQAKIFFELIGDALFAFNMLEDEIVRSTLEFNYTLVLADLTQLIQNAVMTALQQQLWMTPLEGDFAYNKLFGINLLDEIKELALQEQGFTKEMFLSDLSRDNPALFQQFFTTLDEIVEGEENQPSFEDDDDEDDEDGEEEDDDFTEH